MDQLVALEAGWASAGLAPAIAHWCRPCPDGPAFATAAAQHIQELQSLSGHEPQTIIYRRVE